jgi:DNA-binding LacI/PurR family transcriptional regulator
MANRKKRVASIADVAKAAGVSTATVSRVFNERDAVHPETRNHVMATADKIGFQLSDRRPGPKPPSKEVRPLIRFLNFLDVHADAAEVNQTLVLIKRGLETAAEDAGFRLSYNMHGFEDQVVFLPEEGETAGIALVGLRPSKQTEELLKKYPCCWVMTGNWSPTWGDQVMPDHREVGRLAARYLVNQGHKSIVMLRHGSRDRVHRFREEGFEYEMERFPSVKWSVIDSGVMPDDPAVFHPEDELLEALAGNLKRCVLRPTGVFVDHDRTLAKLYPKAVKAGLALGKEIEVISCNNMGIYRCQLPFDYKSIDVHFELIGRLCVGQLLWRMKNPGFSSQVRSLMLPELT